jgi:hypothetical protein
MLGLVLFRNDYAFPIDEEILEQIKHIPNRPGSFIPLYCNLFKNPAYIIYNSTTLNPKSNHMKRIISLSLLLLVVFAGSSFKLKRAEQFKSDGYLVAVIDGKSFEARDENKYTADLMNKSADNNALVSTGGKITRVATAINFYGSDFKDDDNNTFTESLGFEYTFADGSTGEVADQKVILNYNNQRFTSIPAETKIKINKIQWSSDKRSFTMSADFDTKMKSWGSPAQAHQTLHVKGKMEDIVISVPTWIMLKNSVPMAEEDQDK